MSSIGILLMVAPSKYCLILTTTLQVTHFLILAPLSCKLLIFLFSCWILFQQQYRGLQYHLNHFSMASVWWHSQRSLFCPKFLAAQSTMLCCLRRIPECRNSPVNCDSCRTLVTEIFRKKMYFYSDVWAFCNLNPKCLPLKICPIEC